MNSSTVDAVLVGPELEENLSLRYLVSACREAGFGVEIAAFHSEADTPRTLDRIRQLCPSVVGLSLSFQTRVREFADLGQALRDQGFAGHVTAGGHFATLRFELILTTFGWLDSIVLHEGEHTLPSLLEALRSGTTDLRELPGLAVRDSGRVVRGASRPLADLDSLPWPQRSTPRPSTLGIPTAVLLASHGCYGRCSFCSVQTWYRDAIGPKVRQRSIADLVAEIEWLRVQHGVRVFAFNDDNFFGAAQRDNLERLEQLTSALLAKGLGDLAWSIKCRSNDVQEPFLDLLTRIPVALLYVGIETTSPQGLRTLGRGIRQEQNQTALALLSARGIPHTFNLLLFDPDTTLETMEPNLRLLHEHAEVPWNFCRTEVYAGTPLEDRLLAENRLRGDGFGWTYDLADSRADLMYRIASVAFQKRNFHPQGVAALNLSTRYGLTLMRLFGKGAWDTELEARAVAASRAIGESSVRHLREIQSFASGIDLDDCERQENFTTEIARSVHRSDFAALQELKQVRSQIESRMGLTERGVSTNL